MFGEFARNENCTVKQCKFREVSSMNVEVTGQFMYTSMTEMILSYEKSNGCGPTFCNL